MKKIFYLLLTIIILNMMIVEDDFCQEIYNSKSNDFITLSNGSKIYGGIKLMVVEAEDPYVIFNDSIKYLLSDVVIFENSVGYFRTVKNTRFVNNILINEYKLAKRHHIGEISLFTNYSISDPTSRSRDYFSIGHELIEYNYTNLQQILSSKKESKELLNSYNILSIVKWGLIGIGAIITSYSLYNSIRKMKDSKLVKMQTLHILESDQYINIGIFEERGFVFEPSFLIGIGIAVTSAIPYILGKNKLDSAVDIYNR